MANSGQTPVTLSRQDLYDRVWSTSAVQLAKELGVSDVAISKACRRHQIPKPPLGYWAKLAAGKAPPVPALPIVIDPKLQTVTFSPPSPRVARPPAPGDVAAPTKTAIEFESPQIKDLFGRIQQSDISWDVPTSLRALHPVVADALDGLRLASKERRHVRAGEPDLLYPHQKLGEKPLLEIRVSSNLIERAVLLAQGIISAAQEVGFTMVRKRNDRWPHCSFEMFNHHVQFSIKEMASREPHTPTALELAEADRLSYRKLPKWDRIPNGMLCVTVTEPDRRSVLAEFQDGKSRRVELMIEEIVQQMLRGVDQHLTLIRRQREAQLIAIERSEAKRREDERRKAEQQRFDALVTEVEQWELARRIRRFRRVAFRSAVEKGIPVDSSSPADQWLRWVDGVADRLDPFVPKDEPQ